MTDQEKNRLNYQRSKGVAKAWERERACPQGAGYPPVDGEGAEGAAEDRSGKGISGAPHEVCRDASGICGGA